MLNLLILLSAFFATDLELCSASTMKTYDLQKSCFKQTPEIIFIIGKFLV